MSLTRRLLRPAVGIWGTRGKTREQGRGPASDTGGLALVELELVASQLRPENENVVSQMRFGLGRC